MRWLAKKGAAIINLMGAGLMTKGVLTAILEDDTSAVLQNCGSMWINNLQHVECARFNEIPASYWVCCAKDVIIRVRKFFDAAQNSFKVGMIFCRGRGISARSVC